MSSKIFKAIWTVALLVFLASLLLIMGSLYAYFSSIQKTQLRVETELAAQGVALSGAEYFEGLNDGNYRITWVSPEGDVLFDDEADTSTMQNHMERPEIKQALKEGYGEAVRHSYTLADQQYYAAKRLPDGSVLRMSVAQLSVWSLLFGFGQPICFVVLAALILSYVLASRIAAKIVKPINELDLTQPNRYYGEENYEEIEPLLRHIAAQQAQLRSDQEEIEKAALIRQEFSANVSHELKTPLHAISGYAELLENGLVKEEDIKPFAEKIHAESLLETAASAMDISFTLSGETAPVTAIPQLLYSIAYNLCENAIKYNHRGGSVSISVSQGERYTVLTVRDTGVGIPEEEQERIFERFYRVDKSRSKEAGGTGLGLSIVKHAVLIHNGTIRLNSSLGEGSEFIVSIPNKPEDGK